MGVYHEAFPKAVSYIRFLELKYYALMSSAVFDYEGEKAFQKLIIGKQCIQDGKIIISSQEFEDYNAVKIIVNGRDGNLIFEC